MRPRVHSTTFKAMVVLQVWLLYSLYLQDSCVLRVVLGKDAVTKYKISPKRYGAKTLQLGWNPSQKRIPIEYWLFLTGAHKAINLTTDSNTPIQTIFSTKRNKFGPEA